MIMQNKKKKKFVKDLTIQNLPEFQSRILLIIYLSRIYSISFSS